MRQLWKLLAIVLLWLIQVKTLLAQSNAVQLKEALSKAVTTEDKVDAYQALYFHYQYIKPDSAKYFIQRGQEHFSQQRNEQGLASMASLQAFFDMSEGRMEMARTKQKEALAIFERLGNKSGIAAIHSALGVLDGKQERYKEATNHLLTALRIYEQLNDTDGIATANMRIGIINEKSEMLNNALIYYNKSLSLAEKKPGIKGADMVVLNNNIGIVYGRMGNLEKALTHFNAALDGCNSPEKIGIRVMTLNNLGIVYEKFGNDKMALHYLDEAIQLTNTRQMNEEYVRIIITRSSIIRKKHPQKALESLKDASHRLSTLNMPSLEVELSEEMVEAHENCGNYKDALTILKHLRILEDSLQRVEQVKEVMNLQTVHELENTNAQLQIANEKTAATKNVRNIVLFVAVILGIMFLILLLQYKRAIKLNNKLKKREEELEQSNNMKDKLFSIIGHDLRGPISNITSMLQLLNGETITPDEKKYLMDGLIIHTKASAETLDKLLFWGQAQLKGISLNQQDFDSENIVRNNLSLIQMQAMQKKIVVTSKVPPGTRIKADPVHFDFVVRNLLSNAVKFTRIGGNVTIGAIEGQERGFVTFYVHDNGVGIAKERLSDIFETFGKSTRGTANEKGTSIGLMLCKEYVAKNGGRIWVQSELGNGATFSFTMLLPDSAKS